MRGWLKCVWPEGINGDTCIGPGWLHMCAICCICIAIGCCCCGIKYGILRPPGICTTGDHGASPGWKGCIWAAVGATCMGRTYGAKAPEGCALHATSAPSAEDGGFPAEGISVGEEVVECAGTITPAPGFSRRGEAEMAAANTLPADANLDKGTASAGVSGVGGLPTNEDLANEIKASAGASGVGGLPADEDLANGTAGWSDVGGLHADEYLANGMATAGGSGIGRPGGRSCAASSSANSCSARRSVACVWLVSRRTCSSSICICRCCACTWLVNEWWCAAECWCARTRTHMSPGSPPACGLLPAAATSRIRRSIDSCSARRCRSMPSV